MMEEKEGKKETVFRKEEILQSATYADNRDLLSVLLKDNECYTKKEIDDKIDKFYRKGVN